MPKKLTVFNIRFTRSRELDVFNVAKNIAKSRFDNLRKSIGVRNFFSRAKNVSNYSFFLKWNKGETKTKTFARCGKLETIKLLDRQKR